MAGENVSKRKFILSPFSLERRKIISAHRESRIQKINRIQSLLMVKIFICVLLIPLLLMALFQFSQFDILIVITLIALAYGIWQMKISFARISKINKPIFPGINPGELVTPKTSEKLKFYVIIKRSMGLCYLKPTRIEDLDQNLLVGQNVNSKYNELKIIKIETLYRNYFRVIPENDGLARRTG